MNSKTAAIFRRKIILLLPFLLARLVLSAEPQPNNVEVIRTKHAGELSQYLSSFRSELPTPSEEARFARASFAKLLWETASPEEIFLWDRKSQSTPRHEPLDDFYLDKIIFPAMARDFSELGLDPLKYDRNNPKEFFSQYTSAKALRARISELRKLMAELQRNTLPTSYKPLLEEIIAQSRFTTRTEVEQVHASLNRFRDFLKYSSHPDSQDKARYMAMDGPSAAKFQLEKLTRQHAILYEISPSLDSGWTAHMLHRLARIQQLLDGPEEEIDKATVIYANGGLARVDAETKRKIKDLINQPSTDQTLKPGELSMLKRIVEISHTSTDIAEHIQKEFGDWYSKLPEKTKKEVLPYKQEIEKILSNKEVISSGVYWEETVAAISSRAATAALNGKTLPERALQEDAEALREAAHLSMQIDDRIKQIKQIIQTDSRFALINQLSLSQAKLEFDHRNETLEEVRDHLALIDSDLHRARLRIFAVKASGAAFLTSLSTVLAKRWATQGSRPIDRRKHPKIAQRLCREVLSSLSEKPRNPNLDSALSLALERSAKRYGLVLSERGLEDPISKYLVVSIDRSANGSLKIKLNNSDAYPLSPHQTVGLYLKANGQIWLLKRHPEYDFVEWVKGPQRVQLPIIQIDEGPKNDGKPTDDWNERRLLDLFNELAEEEAAAGESKSAD